MVFLGSSKNFLFRMEPKIRLFRTRVSTNGAYQWLNTNSFSFPHGLGFGGDTDNFRLFIPENFDGCIARDACLTFEPGHLVSGEKFEINCLEIWGCGGEEKVKTGLTALAENRKLNQQNIEKARKVDKAAFFNNQFDQEFLLSHTFSHRGQQERPEV
jgi:hypothetical protein